MLAFEIDYIEEARKLARENNNEFITPEHVMYVMSKQDHLSSIFSILEVDTEQLRTDLRAYFEDTKLPDTCYIEPTCSDCLVSALDNMDEFFENYTFALEPVFMQHLCMSGSDFIQNCIEAQNALDKLVDFNDGLIEGALKIPGVRDGANKLEENGNNGENNKKELTLPFLYHINDIVDYDVKAGFIVPRFDYLAKIGDCMSKTDNHHVCLYGEDGVGKESLIYEYVRQQQAANNILYGELDADSILGSAQLATNANEVFRSTLISFQKRLEEYRQDERELKTCLLRIKNVGAMLNSLVINAFSACLLSEIGIEIPFTLIFDVPTAVAMSLKKDRTFKSKVNFIEVKEPTGDELTDILIRNTEYLTEIGRYSKYSMSAVDKAIELANKYFGTESKLNAAINLLDEAGLMHLKRMSRLQMQNPNGAKSKIQKLNEAGISAEYVVEAFETLHKDTSEELDTEAEFEILKNLDKNLKNEVFGQDSAIDTLIRQIELSKAGLLDENKPVGSFMFVGPTGVGKTQLAKSLAKNLGVEFIKYDMSEFSEKHSISKMIGSPAGYVGYEEGGSLVKKINAHPKAVLLLDEIEKAHPSVYNILLQIMDDAVLTDGRQTKANFKDVILIMTSNAGAADSTKRGVGFNNSGVNRDGMKKAVAETFAPEFRGRLSAVVEFNSLNKEVYADIIRKEIRKLNEKLENKEIKVSCSDDIVEYISTQVNTDVSGARGIESYMRENVFTTISHGIISGTINKHDAIRLVLDNNSINFEKIVKNSIE